MEIKLNGEFKGFGDVQGSMCEYQACYSHKEKKITIEFSDRYLKHLYNSQSLKAGDRNTGDLKPYVEEFIDNLINKESATRMFQEIFKEIEIAESKEAE